MRYLDGHMGSLSAFDDWGPQIREEIKTGLSDAVDGMYVSELPARERFALTKA